MSYWQLQWERLGRWYERFRRVNDSVAHVQPSENLADDIVAFFQNCHILCDHLKNDPGSGCVWDNDLKASYAQSRPLRLCRDISNASKHLTFRGAKKGKEPQFSERVLKW